MKDETLHKLIAGGLKTAIIAHGPIDHDLISSAAKRIEHGIDGYFTSEYLNETRQEIGNRYILVEPKHYDNLKKRLNRQQKIVRDLLGKLKEAGVALNQR